MPRRSVSQAARLADVDRTTLYRKKEKGELSFDLDEKGATVIDLSELARVYPNAARKYAAQHPQQQETPQSQHDATIDATGATTEKAVHVRGLQLEIDLLHERIGELKEQRDRWQAQAERLALKYEPSVESPRKPAQDENGNSEGVSAPTAVKGAQGLNAGMYGLLIVLMIVITAIMSYYDAEIRAVIDEGIAWAGLTQPAATAPVGAKAEPVKPGPAKVERRQENRRYEQEQTFPQSFPEPYPF